jgi:hypothetical protein
MFERDVFPGLRSLRSLTRGYHLSPLRGLEAGINFAVGPPLCRDAGLRTKRNKSRMDKRAAKREFKEAKTVAGIYRVHNVAEDRSLVGASINVTAILNRHRAGLRMGGHENKKLQSDWNRLGEAGFAFEVVDTLKEADRPGTDVKRELATLEQLWLERLAPYGERGYNSGPK